MTLQIDHYVRGDIVSELVNRNAVTYGGPEKVFIVCDLKKDRLPPADCVLCRDCLGHLSFKHIFEALQNIQRNRCIPPYYDISWPLNLSCCDSPVSIAAFNG